MNLFEMWLNLDACHYISYDLFHFLREIQSQINLQLHFKVKP